MTVANCFCFILFTKAENENMDTIENIYSTIIQGITANLTSAIHNSNLLKPA